MVLAFGNQAGGYYDEQGNWVDTSAQEQAILQGGGQPLAQPSGYDPAAAEARAEAMYGGTMYAGGAGATGYADPAPPPPPADPAAGPSPGAADAAAAEAAAYERGNAYSTGTPAAEQAWAPPPYSSPSPQTSERVAVTPADYYDRAAGMAEATANPFYDSRALPATGTGAMGYADPTPPPPGPERVTALPTFEASPGPRRNVFGERVEPLADRGAPRTRGPAPGTAGYYAVDNAPLLANSALDVPPTYPERLGDLRTPEQRRRDEQRAREAEDARLLAEARERESTRRRILDAGAGIDRFVMDRARDFGGFLADRNRDAQQAQQAEARGDELLRESRQPVRQPEAEPGRPPRRSGGMAGVWAPETRDAAPPEPDASFEAVEASRASREPARVPPPPGPLTAIPGRPGFALDEGGPAAYGAMGLNIPPPPGVGRGPSTGAGEPAVVGAGGEVAAMAAPETLLPGGPVLRAPAFHADIAGAPGAAPSLLPPPPAPRARVVAVNIGQAAPLDPDALPEVTDVRVGPPRPTIDQQIASMNAVRETPMPPEEEARMRALLAGEEPPPPGLWDQFLAAAAGLPAYLGLDNRADERMRGQRPGGVFVPAVTGGAMLDDPGRPMRAVFVPEITGGTADFVPPPPGPGLGDRLTQLVRDDFDNFDRIFGGSDIPAGGAAEREVAPPELDPTEVAAVDARGQEVRVGGDGVVRDRAGNPIGATSLGALPADQTRAGDVPFPNPEDVPAFPGDATLTLPGNATQLSPAEVEAAIAEAGLAEAPASGSGDSGGGGGSGSSGGSSRRRSSGGGGSSSGGGSSRRSRRGGSAFFDDDDGDGPRGALTRLREYEDGSYVARDEDGNMWVYDPDTDSFRPFGRKSRKGKKGKRGKGAFADPIFDRYKQVAGAAIANRGRDTAVDRAFLALLNGED